MIEGASRLQTEVPRAVERLAAAWHRIECVLAVAALSLVGLLLIIDVGGRELLAPLLRSMGVTVGATGIPGGQKIAIYALVIGSFCGVGIATARNAHLVPQVGFGWTPARYAPLVDRFADLLTGVFLLVVAWYGLTFVWSSMASGMRAPVLDWPVWPFQLAIPIGFASAAGRYLLFARWPGLKAPPPEYQD